VTFFENSSVFLRIACGSIGSICYVFFPILNQLFCSFIFSKIVNFQIIS